MRILSLPIRGEADVVLARQRARQVADALGFETQDQTRIATAVSEIGRNAAVYAGGGKVEIALEGTTSPQLLVITISDQGPGVAQLQTVLEGRYQSPTGMGLGIIGARRLMDQCDIESQPGRGTVVRLKKLLPPQMPVIDGPQLARIAETLAHQRLHDPLAEVQRQNQELVQTLEELRTRQDELLYLNRELEDTNRGVVALYAELDEKADHLRRADEVKTRFLSNMSHEFRTPVNSILALSRLLLDHTDGPLTTEQEKQVTFMRKAAQTLLELVDDLLDLTKIEAGKLTVRPTEFTVADLFSALRGMLRPLLVTDAVALVFEEPVGIPLVYSDEGKLSQILRNFLSNALKFTERGEVRVSATLTVDKGSVIFTVADTGIGIALEDQEKIFLEFTQLENPLQKRVKGTGLGLPLCKRLVELLGGRIAVTSTVGVGSTFSVTIPLHYRAPLGVQAVEASAKWELDPERLPVLIVEDNTDTQFLYEKFLAGSTFQGIPVRTVREAQAVLLQVTPRAIILDILLPGRDSWAFLTELKARDDTKDIPIMVATTVEDERKGWALGADAYALKPLTQERLLGELQRLTGQVPLPRVLIIDDEEMARYIFTQCLLGLPCVISEAATGREGLQRARSERPDVIVLDLAMPGMDGTEVLQHLAADPATQHIPVIICSSRILTAVEQAQLTAQVVTVLSKETLAPNTLQDMLTAVLQAA